MYHAILYSVNKDGLKIQFTDGTTNIWDTLPLDQLTTKQDLIDFCTAKITTLNTTQIKQSNLLTALESLIGNQII